MPKVTIYTDTWGVPHTFLGLTDNNGTSKYRGFAPDTTGLFGNGLIRDEYNYEINALREYNFKFEFEVSNEKFNALNYAIANHTYEQTLYYFYLNNKI